MGIYSKAMSQHVLAHMVQGSFKVASLPTGYLNAALFLYTLK